MRSYVRWTLPETRGAAPPPARGTLCPPLRPRRRAAGTRPLPRGGGSEDVPEGHVPLVHSRRSAILALLPVGLENELFDGLESDAESPDRRVVLRIARVAGGDARLRVELLVPDEREERGARARAQAQDVERALQVPPPLPASDGFVSREPESLVEQ